MSNFLDHLGSPIEIGSIVFWRPRGHNQYFEYGEVIGLTKKRVRVRQYLNEFGAQNALARAEDFLKSFESEYKRLNRAPKFYLPYRFITLRNPADMTVIHDISQLPETIQKGIALIENSEQDFLQIVNDFS